MIVNIIIGIIGYIGFVLFIARMASSKWHPTIKEEEES